MQTGVRTNLVGRIDLSAYAVAVERRALVGHRSGWRAREKRWMGWVDCHVAVVTCHVAVVTCHVAAVAAMWQPLAPLEPRLRHYVFMCLAPSFLRSRGGAVTLIT